MCSFTRSKYGTYPEYHTSLDDLSFISPDGLEGSFTVMRACIERLESSPRWMTSTFGEPQMGRRNLYPTLSLRDSTFDSKYTAGEDTSYSSREIMNVLSYCDGEHDSREIAELVALAPVEVDGILNLLAREELIHRPGESGNQS